MYILSHFYDSCQFWKDRIIYALKTVYLKSSLWPLTIWKGPYIFDNDGIFSTKDRIYIYSEKTEYFQQKTVYFSSGPYIFRPGPYIFQQDRIFYQDRIFSRTVYFTFQDRLFYHIVIFRYMFPIYVCFQTKIMFPIYRICFQTLLHVSNILFLFPISDVCFQYTFYVSKRKRCFQTTMFPMYVSNIHGAAFPITLI